MLVLTRKLQQQIKIGEQITVTILKVKGNTVRVGISAPREVRVVRGELPKEGAAAETVEVEATVVEEAAITIGEQSDATVEAVEEAARRFARQARRLPHRPPPICRCGAFDSGSGRRR